jgi:glycosyltransferase domain-containing protein
MRFWSGREALLHVFDGTSEPIAGGYLDTLAENVHYHHMPVPLLERLGAATNFTDREYVALLGDDDFHMPSGLSSCIQALDVDRELVACIGRAVGFRAERGEVVAWPAYPGMAGYEVAGPDPSERMLRHMREYACSTIYGVVRTDLWCHAMRLVSERQYSVSALAELQFELMVAYGGASRVIQQVTWLRSDEAEGIRDEHDVVVFPQWWRDPGADQSKRLFVQRAAQALARWGHRDVEGLEKAVVAACEAYCEFYDERALRRRPPRRPLGSVMAALPHPLDVGFKRILSLLRGRTRVRLSLLEYAERLHADGIGFEAKELREIRETVLAHAADPTADRWT